MWLKVKKLELKYKEKYIYENCTFENADHVLIINGKNGVGKTSILNLIYKQNNHKYKGEIFLCGKDLKSFSKKQIRNKISYINQSPILFEQYKVKDNLKILNIDSKKYNHYQSKFYLKKIFDKKVEELSGGEKQILNLCIGLSKESEIIFLDEPLNNG